MNRRQVRDPRVRSYEDVPVKYMSVSNIEVFNGNFPTFQMPKNVGSFSLDIYRNYCNDYSGLRYLALPPGSSGSWEVLYDLGRGLSEVVEKDEAAVSNTMLDHLLTWILQERRAGNLAVVDVEKPLHPLLIEFVCFRGLLTMLIKTPYESQESWKIMAAKFQNTIYLWELKDDKMNRNMSAKQREMCIWGFKFEQYLCADSPDSLPNPDEILNTNAEFCCVLKTKLAGRSLLYGAEVDAVRKECYPPFVDLQDFVELKTNRRIDTEKQNVNFKRFKSIKWWAQSFIVGIPKIIVGYRDDNGFVSHLKTVDVKQLQKDSSNFWKANICMNFCHQFLEFVKNSMAHEDNPNNHFVFEFDPSRRVITCHSNACDLKRNLLPTWYINSMGEPVQKQSVPNNV